jgi:hypothetical protein
MIYKYIMILESLLLLCILCVGISLYDRWSTNQRYGKCIEIALSGLENRNNNRVKNSLEDDMRISFSKDFRKDYGRFKRK